MLPLVAVQERGTIYIVTHRRLTQTYMVSGTQSVGAAIYGLLTNSS